MDKIIFKPKSIILGFWLMSSFAASLILGGIGAVTSAELKVNPWIGFVACVLFSMLILGAYLVMYFQTIIFELDERYITKSSGVLWKQKRSVPLEKITNIDIRQGPLERMFGIGNIWIFTPSTGAAMPEETLFGVGDPHEMKKEIIARSEKAKFVEPTHGKGQVEKKSTNDMVEVLKEIRDTLNKINHKLADGEEKA